MLAPIIGGLLFDFVGYPFSALFIAGWNLVSVVVEYMLLILIYRFVLTFSDATSSFVCIWQRFSQLGKKRPPG